MKPRSFSPLLPASLAFSAGLALAVLSAGGCATLAGRGATVEIRDLHPCARHLRIVRDEGPWIINVLEVHLGDRSVLPGSARARDRVRDRETTSSMAQRSADSLWAVLGAVNADFFEPDGESVSHQIADGTIVQAVTRPQGARSPVRSQFAVTADARCLIEKFDYRGKAVFPGGEVVPVTAVNLWRRTRGPVAFNRSLDVANLGLWEWNLNKDMVYFDQRRSQMLGYSLDESESDFAAWQNRIPRDDKLRLLKTLERHLADPSGYFEAEYRLQADSGEWKWILDRGKVVENDQNGKALRMVGICLDITDRKRVYEEQLYETVEQFQGIFESARDCIFVKNSRLRYTQVNPYFAGLLDSPESQIVGRTDAELFGKDSTEILAEVGSARTEGRDRRTGAHASHQGSTKDLSGY